METERTTETDNTESASAKLKRHAIGAIVPSMLIVAALGNFVAHWETVTQLICNRAFAALQVFVAVLIIKADKD